MDEPSLLTSWSLEPLQLVPTIVVAALYARRVRTLRRRGTPVEPWRPWLFGLGIGLVLLALASPIDTFGEEEFLRLEVCRSGGCAELPRRQLRGGRYTNSSACNCGRP